MKAVPLGSQNTVEFTASLPFSQHSCVKLADKSHLLLVIALRIPGEMLYCW
jgi:hypothetical protein